MTTPTCPNGHTEGFNTLGNAVMDCVICGAKPVMQSFPTDEQLNIAMCKWMGWKWKRHRINLGDVADSIAWETGWVPPKGVPPNTPLPNYLSDDSPRRLLNEAEARLTDEQHSRFRKCLRAPFEKAGAKYGEIKRHYYSATARQRVIAILQTIKPEMF